MNATGEGVYVMTPYCSSDGEVRGWRMKAKEDRIIWPWPKLNKEKYVQGFAVGEVCCCAGHVAPINQP